MQKSTCRKKYFPSDENLMTAIIVCSGPGNIGSPFKKYHNISNTEASKKKFLIFACKFPGISHINFYEKKKTTAPGVGEFIEQITVKI